MSARMSFQVRACWRSADQLPERAGNYLARLDDGTTRLVCFDKVWSYPPPVAMVLKREAVLFWLDGLPDPETLRKAHQLGLTK